MKPEIRAKCINITKEIFQQPIGIFVRKELPLFLDVLPDNIPSLNKIEEKLEKWEYSSIQEWHDDIIGLLSTISHECGQNLSLIIDTLIQMIEDEINGFIFIKEEKVVNDILYAVEHYLPNSKFDYYHDRKPPSLPQNIHKKIPEKAPEFTYDSIISIKDRICNIHSTRQLSKIGKIILSNIANESGITEIKGGISVILDSLSPYSLQIIQNYLDKIEREKNTSH